MLNTREANFEQAPANLPSLRARMARRKNELYLRSEKLRSLLSHPVPRKILFSEKPDWADAIKGGFRRLPHRIEFGPINEESFVNYDIVVPLTLHALKAVRRCAGMQRNLLPIPSAEAVRLCDDKYMCNKVLIEAGLGRYIPDMVQGQALKRPFILKKRIEAWGRNCFIVRTIDEEQAQLSRIKDPDYFCQELVPGSEEFATHILFIDGKVVKALNIKYEFARQSPIKGQDQELLKVVHRCPYLDLFARMLRTIKFEGLCCLNYKVAYGQPFLLEINPRFGGSLSPYFFSFVRYLG